VTQIPGNKLPGYDHDVPTGQQTVRTCPHFRFHIMPGFEDDDDEHENEDPSILSPNPPWC